MTATARQADALAAIGFQSREYPLQALDLAVNGASAQWSVAGLSTAQIRLFGSNAVAVVVVERSHDGGASWEDTNPPLRRVGSGPIRGIPCVGANRLRLRVSTADGSGTVENVSFYADQSKTPIQNKILAQARPSGTSLVSLWAPAVEGEAVELVIGNTSVGTANYKVCVDVDGTTYDETTALCWNVALAAGRTDRQALGFGLSQSGSIGVATSSANALTFTLIGRDQALDAAR